jgi:hypothetical protein
MRHGSKTGVGMIRRFFTLLSAMSLLLCIATVVVWTRRARCRDVFTFPLGTRHAFWVESVRSGMQFVMETDPLPVDTVAGWSVMEPSDALPANTGRGFGAVSAKVLLSDETTTNMTTKVVGITAVDVPHWLIVALTAVFPVWNLLAFRRRRHAGTCRKCGYDLRATPDRCPECGTVPSVAKVRV